MPKKKTNTEFIAAAQAIHGNKYDYSQTCYNGRTVKILVGCPKHGVFQQRPSNHLTGNGCTKCAVEAHSHASTHSKEQFIKKARATHGMLYDYSQVAYTDNKTRVSIICREHGPFQQAPGNHTCLKQGCPKCAYRIRQQHRKYTTESFISKAIATHGDRYDYTYVTYEDCFQKVKIRCISHGLFNQAPHSHIQGNGCRKCAAEHTATAVRDTTESFIRKAQIIHGTFYNYSQVVYKDTKTKVIIGCPVHGTFKQQPVIHLQASGCPQCGFDRITVQRRLTWIEQAEGHEATLYFLKVFDDKEVFYKVGITFHSVHTRYNCKRRLGRYSYELLASYKSRNVAAIYDWEQSILETFAHLRYHPKARFHGVTECFAEEQQILACFPV